MTHSGVRTGLAAALAVAVSLGALPLFSPLTSAGTQWTIEVADGSPGSGQWTSLALAPDGSPRVAYQRGAFPGITELRYAWRNAAGWHNETVDSASAPDYTAFGPSLAVDAGGIPHVSYITSTREGFIGHLRVWHARWNATSSSWDKKFVADAGYSFDWTFTSIALDQSGSPAIAFVNYTTGELTAARKSGSAWNSTVVDVLEARNLRPSLKFDSLGRLHVAYYNGTTTSGSLKYARWDGGAWTNETVDASPPRVGAFPSLALDASDRPRVAYMADAAPSACLKYAAWEGFSWNFTCFPSTGGVEPPSLALDALGNPRIAWNDDATFYLMYARWDGQAWRVEVADTDRISLWVSMVVDATGVAHIAYYQGSIGVLKYARGEYVNDPPASSLATVTPYWHTSGSLALDASASDPDGTVASVDLYYRFDGGSGFGPWTLYAADPAAPWSWTFPFPDGDGRYEFYSLASDGTDFEAAKTAAEATAGYDATPPVSSVDLITPYWRDSPPLPLTATAADALSGVASVTFRYRFAADNLTWGPWTDLGTDTTAPWSTAFPFPDGPGFYEFHALAADVAGNAEGAKTVAEARAALVAPLLSPREVTTVWDGVENVSLSWVEPPTPSDRYLVYRTADPTGFADLSPAAAYATVPAPSTAWADPEPFTATGERYYVMRSQVNLPVPLTSATSNTAGVFAGTLDAGLTAISRPLEYFPWVDYSSGELDTVGEYRTAFAASRVEYLDAAGSWQRVPGPGDPNTVLEVGRAYVVARANPGRFVFTGLPGAQLLYADAPGFDPAGDARDLQVTISGDDVLLTFTQPPAVTPDVDTYEVLVTTTRAGFFDGSAVLVSGIPVLAGQGPTMAVTDAGALLRSPELYYMVTPVTAAGVGASTYSVGVFTRTFQGSDTLALPLRPATAVSVDSLADAIPNTLGILYLSRGAWVPHFRAMPAGVYDAAVVLGGGYQITVAAVSRHSFVGS